MFFWIRLTWLDTVFSYFLPERRTIFADVRLSHGYIIKADIQAESGYVVADRCSIFASRCRKKVLDLTSCVSVARVSGQSGARASLYSLVVLKFDLAAKVVRAR